MRSLLDRLLLLRTAVTTLVILLAIALVVFGMEFVLRYNALSRGSLDPGDSRLVMILTYYTFRLPELAGPLLTIATMAAGLVITGPLLKRRELIALCASGISLRRICRPLLLVAIAVGGLQIIVADQINPRLEAPRSALLDKLEGATRHGRSWRDGAVAGFANHVLLHQHPAELRGIILANDLGGLLTGDRLIWQDGGWLLQGSVIELTADGGRRFAKEQACIGMYSLSHDPATLARELISRYAMTSSELLAEKDHLSRTMAYQRFSAGLAPLLALMMALAVFVRFANADRVMTAAIQALLAGAVPPLLLGLGNLALETAGLPAAVGCGLVTLVAIAPALVVWLRWRL